MGCSQTKVEKSWPPPSPSPPGHSSSGSVETSTTAISTEALVVTHAKAKLTELGAPMLEYSQYTIKRFLQEGGMGQVYQGIRKVDGFPVALKFFGYTHRVPSEESIRDEIRIMMALKNVDGVVHLHGTFLDSPSGYVPGKKFLTPRPVLVMDYLEGGDLCDRILQMSAVSESDLANVFRQLLVALQGIHHKRYIHRDLKLENIMLLNQQPNFPIRLIDFGMMVELPENQDVLISKIAVGTPGYIAPESILRREYSFKTDVWQAGCCFYNLLSGHFPFDPDNSSQITELTYYPMVGVDWDHISSAAKQLVGSMLQKNPDQRPSIETLLQHTWLTGNTASQSDLGKRYSMRIKNLSLRRKLKRFFVNNDLNLAIQRKKLETIFPSIKVTTSTEANLKNLSSPLDVFNEKISTDSDNGTITQEKLDTFQTLMMNELQSQPTPPHPHSHPHGSLKSHNSGRLLSERPKKEVDYSTFCSILEKAELPELAKESVFAMFDANNTGTIDLKEFLLAMLAFRPTQTTGSDEEDNTRLYFNLFDLNQSGRIDHDELKLCLENLLTEEVVRARSLSFPSDNQHLSDPHSPNHNSPSNLAAHVMEMFLAIDTSKDGYIDYEEFKQFYQTIMAHNSVAMRNSSSPMNTSLLTSSSELEANHSPSNTEVKHSSPAPAPSRSLSPLPNSPPRSNSSSPPPLPRQYSPPPTSAERSTSSPVPVERSRPESSSPSPTPTTPSSSSSAVTQTSSSVRKGTSAGVAARIQGLDPSKIMMPGMQMPPKKAFTPPSINKSTSLPPDSSQSGVVNVDPLMSRGVLKTNKPRRRMTVRRKSSAGLKETFESLPTPLPEQR